MANNKPTKPTLPQERIADALDYILKVIDPTWDGKVDGYYLPQNRMATQLEQLQVKIKEDGGIYAKVPIHICSSDEYNHRTGKPTIENPEANTFYLVPSGASSDDMFIEWIYNNDRWEKFGSSGGAFTASLGGLSDVELSSPEKNHALVYNPNTQTWINQELRSVCIEGESGEEWVLDAGTAAELE